MKKTFTLIFCLIYTFVTFGGSIFVHNCGDNVLLSIYEKSTHDNCPICSNKDKTDEKSKSCADGSCKDVEIKIDQLSDDFFPTSKADNFLLHPAIFQRYGLNLAIV